MHYLDNDMSYSATMVCEWGSKPIVERLPSKRVCVYIYIYSLTNVCVCVCVYMCMYVYIYIYLEREMSVNCYEFGHLGIGYESIYIMIIDLQTRGLHLYL